MLSSVGSFGKKGGWGGSSPGPNHTGRTCADKISGAHVTDTGEEGVGAAVGWWAERPAARSMASGLRRRGLGEATGPTVVAS